MTYERTFESSAPLAPDAGSAVFTDREVTGAIPVGCPVYTADDDKLGTVKELQHGCFKVDAKMQPDYWLSTGSVATVGPERVVMSFTKDRLGEFKTDPPTRV